ncbi:MAG: 3-hydroxybutyryl-CoA dehydrogenase [Flammeovirgaceae bacterium]|nr:3-hydroxybutyryl-CoA dehydrogenase [Flammeovirgaceae bacterium]
MADKANLRVAVLGAGTMGSGIAQVCALAGCKAILYDVKEEFVRGGMERIGNSLKQGVEKGKVKSEEMKIALDAIKPVTELKEVKADIIIEAIPEDLALKQKIFSELENINGAKALLLSNTSTIPITRIASVLKNPGNCAGLHFFNPAHIMKLVEIIAGESTSEDTIQQVRKFAEIIGKKAVLAKDSPGFIVNRVARHFYVESLKILEENIADIETIDQLIQSTGFKMGPFKLMDLIGVDVNFAVTQSMYNSFHQDSKFRPSRIQQQKVEAGHLGRKSGRGFYAY